jgi:hypothetical protein
VRQIFFFFMVLKARRSGKFSTIIITFMIQAPRGRN